MEFDYLGNIERVKVKVIEGVNTTAIGEAIESLRIMLTEGVKDNNVKAEMLRGLCHELETKYSDEASEARKKTDRDALVDKIIKEQEKRFKGMSVKDRLNTLIIDKALNRLRCLIIEVESGSIELDSRMQNVIKSELAKVKKANEAEKIELAKRFRRAYKKQVMR